MKTKLTSADKDKVWRSTNPTWLHYFWWGGGWMIAPCDPRTNPMLTNIHTAHEQKDGRLFRSTGFVEVP